MTTRLSELRRSNDQLDGFGTPITRVLVEETKKLRSCIRNTRNIQLFGQRPNPRPYRRGKNRCSRCGMPSHGT